MGSKRTRKGQRGWTLIELVMVIAIIGILSAIAVRAIMSSLENARFNATVREMEHLVWAVTGNPDLVSAGARTDFGYVGDTGEIPPNLDALISDPGGVCGWDGPYITVDFEQNPNDYKTDSWGIEYTYGITGQTLQLISDSAGTKTLDDTTDILYNTVQVQLYNSDGVPLTDLSGDISIEYGCGWNAMSYDESTGKFFIDTVPIGQRLVRGVASGDTTYKTINVLPGSNTSIEMTVYPTFGTISSVACATVSGTGNEIIAEEVNNNGSPTFLINKLTITWADDGNCWACATAYLEKVEMGGVTYWQWDTNGRTSRVGSGSQIILDDIMYIYNGNSTIDLTFNETLTDDPGQPINMTAAGFTIKFHSTNAPAQLVAFVACGTACAAPNLFYAASSASVSGGGNEKVEHTVTNSGSQVYDANQLVVTWANGSCWSGTPYLDKIKVGGVTYWDFNLEGGGSRAVSGQTLTLGQTLNLPNGDTVIEEMKFKDAVTGGQNINMEDTDFTITFKSSCFDDQLESFTTPGGCTPCVLGTPSGTASGAGFEKVQVDMTNSGTSNCGITQMKITCTTGGTQPWVDKVKTTGTTYWDKNDEGGGSRGNTTSGSETTLVLNATMVLGSGAIQIDEIKFKDAITGGSNIDMRGVIMTIEFTLTDCGGCTTPQNVSFTVN